MSITDELKKAEREGRSLKKEKLLALVKNAGTKQYPIAKDQRGVEYVIIPL